MDKSGIQINRNIIERSLMIIKEYIKRNKKIILYTLSIGVLIVIIIITGVVYYRSEENREIVEFEKIIEEYRNSYSNEKSIDESIEIQRFQETIDKLKKLIDSSYWGYVNENGYYVIADLYESQKMFRDAKEYFLKFVEESPSSFFAPFALRKAGNVCEHLGELEEAFQIYQRLEREYSNSMIADGIYFDMGRIYQKKGNTIKAREYYNRLISQYPFSLFTNKAKNRLFLLEYLTTKDK
ncbi:MAG: tetratricopeptide repeat protein [Spirochaetota bacterium]|nr:tetratricopeptide repeat protein [Spirochaetota bacterium]